MTDPSAKKQVDGGPAASRQVLTFCLDAETYGVDILRVQEIRGWSPVTRIPKSPPHVLGVLNLRGSIVPIVDLRVRFSLERAEFTPLTVIIVLSIMTPTETPWAAFPSDTTTILLLSVTSCDGNPNMSRSETSGSSRLLSVITPSTCEGVLGTSVICSGIWTIS